MSSDLPRSSIAMEDGSVREIYTRNQRYENRNGDEWQVYEYREVYRRNGRIVDDKGWIKKEWKMPEHPINNH